MDYQYDIDSFSDVVIQNKNHKEKKRTQPLLFYIVP